jgi:hypothetical protein
VYNPAKNISIDGTTASVEVENEYIKAQPGWFFTSVHHVIMEENKNYDISAVMQQQTRELMFVLVTPKDFAEEIDHISASLNGVASQLDIPSGDVTGWPMSIKLDFTMNTDTTFVSTTRILGLIDETQILTCSITFNKDHLPIIHKVFELQTLLEDFNADKITPMNLSITIIPDSSSKSKKPETIR